VTASTRQHVSEDVRSFGSPSGLDIAKHRGRERRAFLCQQRAVFVHELIGRREALGFGDGPRLFEQRKDCFAPTIGREDRPDARAHEAGDAGERGEKHELVPHVLPDLVRRIGVDAGDLQGSRDAFVNGHDDADDDIIEIMHGGAAIIAEPVANAPRHSVTTAVAAFERSDLPVLVFRNTGTAHVLPLALTVKGRDAEGQMLFERDAKIWYVLAGGTRALELDLPKPECERVREIEVAAALEAGTVVERLATPRGACEAK
jgi:hypothetical protein